VFLNTFYNDFLGQIYADASLAEAPYAKQLDALNYPCFGDSDFYSTGLAKAGFDTWDFVINCAPSQVQWARENHVEAKSLFEVIEAQVDSCGPDVIYIQDLNVFSREHLERLKAKTKLVVGQIASPLGQQVPLDLYDVMVSSFPHFVERFNAEGVKSYYQPLAFDPRVLERLAAHERNVELSFVGGISAQHSKGTQVLAQCAERIQLDIWGYGAETLPVDNILRQHHHGPVFGMDLFSAFARSKITLNRHIDVAENNANNMRLYEATGCGALLITDDKDNLHELFEVGKEVLTYASPQEAVELAEYYTRHPDEAGVIAAAGQARTLQDHTYEKRMAKTAQWLNHELEN